MATDALNEPLLVSGGYDHTIRVWQPYSGVCLRTMQHTDSQVNSIDISPKRNMLAACGYQHIRLYDLHSNYPIVNFEGVTKNVTSVGFQEDGKWMYTGGEDGKVRIWDMSSPNPSCKRIFDCQSPVNAVCLLPNQVELLMAHQGGGIYLWDVKSDQHDHLLPEVECSIQDVAVSPNGTYMAAVNNKGNCFVWTLSSSSAGGVGEADTQLTRPEAKLKIPAHEKYGLRCRFSPDSSMLVTCSGGSTARIYRTDTWALHAELRIERFWMWDAIFNNDSKYLFTASSDHTPRLWRIDTKTIEREYNGHSKAVTALAFRDERIDTPATESGLGLSSTH
ncbi:protein LST8 homolog [Anopheles ziemanni]|uniref:protein LST8 homolog n=1 Tax=Anopheles coustani TaxID=139045 RepID=UPI00265A47F9|nr:protein LST8 homolog [Anopheles coustani]XP_058175970.1 protein LST8 homolog [Anopheles ziemanni]